MGLNGINDHPQKAVVRAVNSSDPVRSDEVDDDDIKPEDRAQIYKFLIAGWRKHQEALLTSPAAKMMKQSRLIKDKNIRQRAHDFIREGLELDD